jgi:hypothetical protein
LVAAVNLIGFHEHLDLLVFPALLLAGALGWTAKRHFKFGSPGDDLL